MDTPNGFVPAIPAWISIRIFDDHGRVGFKKHDLACLIEPEIDPAVRPVPVLPPTLHPLTVVGRDQPQMLVTQSGEIKCPSYASMRRRRSISGQAGSKDVTGVG